MKRRALENQDGPFIRQKKRSVAPINPRVKIDPVNVPPIKIESVNDPPLIPNDSTSKIFRSTAGHAFDPKIIDGDSFVNDILFFHKEPPSNWTTEHPSDGNFEMDLDLAKVLRGVSSESPFTEILLDSPCGTLDTEISDFNCKPYLQNIIEDKIQDELPLGDPNLTRSGPDLTKIGPTFPHLAPLLINLDTIKTIKRSMKNTSKLVSTFTTLKTTYLKLCKEFNYLLTKFNDNEKIKFELLHENNELRKLLKEIITEREVDRKRANRSITTA